MRHFLLAMALVAGCGRSEPAASPPPSPPVQARKPEPPPPLPEPQPEKRVPAEQEAPPRKPESTFKPEEMEAGTKLEVQYVELANPGRLCHGVIAFAADSYNAHEALKAHRSHKEEIIAKLHKTKASGDAGLYLVWGHYPQPSLKVGDLRAAYDPKTKRIRVILPPWSGTAPKDGIGLDWRKVDRSAWTFVGYRAKLSGLEAGVYDFEVIEVDGSKSRSLASGTLTLAP